MPLIVEDGTGLADADSYCSAAAADAHHAARGATLWATLLADEKDQALRRATDYMVAVYGPLWTGMRVSAAQALDWPRSGAERAEVGGVWASDVVPPVVVQACAELAFRAAAGPLLGDQGRAVTEQTVGPITTKYETGGSQAKRYAQVDAMLSQMLTAARGSAVMRLVRA